MDRRPAGMGEEAVDQLLTGVLTSAIVGGLSWGGGQVLKMLGRKNAGTTFASVQSYQSYQMAPGMTSGLVPGAPQATRGVNPSQVLIHIGLLQFLVNLVGFTIGVIVGISSGSSADPQTVQGVVELLILIFGTLTAIIFFLIIGLRLDRSVRWRHLSLVALGTAVATLLVNFVVSVARTGTSPLLSSTAVFVASVLFALAQSFVSMGIGGGIAALFSPKRAPVPVGVGQPYMPAPGAPYPYGYAAPPSTPMYPGYPTPPGAPHSTPLYPGYAAPPSTPMYPYPGYAAPPSPPMYPGYPPAPGAPGAAPVYPPYGPQQPAQPGAQASGAYPPGWGAPPAANPNSPPSGAYPPPQPPPAQEQGDR
jgi:hypothetical protein